MLAAQEAFAHAMRDAGVVPPEIIIADGRLHRYSTTGKRGDKAGWYVLYDDGIPAGAFGDWREDINEKWQADLGRRLTPAEKAEQARRIEEARRQAEEARRQYAQQAAELAAAIWKAAQPVGSEHPYLCRKGVAATPTLRELDAAELVRRIGYTPQAKGEPLQGRILIVPVRTDGKLATLEFIDSEGRKSALAGGVKKGGYWATGPLAGQSRIVIAEGVATALSIAEALGEPVAAALCVGNLQAAGEALRAAYPNAELIIAADLEKKTGKPHPASIKAAQHLGCPLAIPDFGPNRQPEQTDFNDLAAACGLEVVRQRFETAAIPEPLDADAILTEARRRLLPDVTERMPNYPLAALGPLAEVAEAIASGKQTPTAIAGQSALMTASLLISAIYDVETLDGDRRPTSLYGLIVSPSGSGKDAADVVATRAVRNWQRDANSEYLAALAQFEAAASKPGRRGEDEEPQQRPRAPHRLCNDITVEGLRRSFWEGAPAQGAFSTEAAAVLAGHGFSSDHRAKTAASLCALWDRGHLSALRAGTGRLELYDLRLTVSFAIQPAAVAEPLSDPLLSNIGLWPRFLLAWPQDLKPRRALLWRDHESPAVHGFWARCNQLLALPLPSGDRPVLPLSRDAWSALAAFFEEMERRAARGGDLWDVRPFALRAAEQATRIAAVLAAWDRREAVSGEDAANGITLARYSLECWRQALSKAQDRDASRALELLEWLLERPGATAKLSDILRLGPASLRSKTARNAALEHLVAAGLVVVSGSSVEVAEFPPPPPANSANSAKTRTSAGISGCEPLANPCESPANPQPEARDIRNHSQSIRKPESLAPQAFSQDSQLSQGYEGGFATAGDADGEEVETI